MLETNVVEQNEEKRMKRSEYGLRELWDNIKHTNIDIIRVQEEERKGLGKYKKR